MLTKNMNLIVPKYKPRLEIDSFFNASRMNLNPIYKGKNKYE